MYYEKLLPILSDLENKEVEIAGGSVVCMVLSITNALIDYICNLTKDKKNYENVRDEVLIIKKETPTFIPTNAYLTILKLINSSINKEEGDGQKEEESQTNKSVKEENK